MKKFLLFAALTAPIVFAAISCGGNKGPAGPGNSGGGSPIGQITCTNNDGTPVPCAPSPTPTVTPTGTWYTATPTSTGTPCFISTGTPCGSGPSLPSPPPGTSTATPSMTPTSTATQTATATATATVASHAVSFTASGSFTAGSVEVQVGCTDAGCGGGDDQILSGPSFSYASPSYTVSAGATLGGSIVKQIPNTFDMSAATLDVWVDGTLWKSVSLPSGIATGTSLSLAALVLPNDPFSVPAGSPVNVVYELSSASSGNLEASYFLPGGGTVLTGLNEAFASPTLQFYPGQQAEIIGNPISSRTDTLTATILQGGSPVTATSVSGSNPVAQADHTF